jgi:hypothetical protein
MLNPLVAKIRQSVVTQGVRAKQSGRCEKKILEASRHRVKRIKHLSRLKKRQWHQATSLAFAA